MSYANKLKDSLTWWLSKSRSFSINEEYKLELLFVDVVNRSAKIRITNLKTGHVVDQISDDQEVHHGE